MKKSLQLPGICHKAVKNIQGLSSDPQLVGTKGRESSRRGREDTNLYDDEFS